MKTIYLSNGQATQTVNICYVDNPTRGTYEWIIRLPAGTVDQEFIAKFNRDQLISELRNHPKAKVEKEPDLGDAPRGGDINLNSALSAFTARLLALKKLKPADALQAATALLPELKGLRLDAARGAHPDPLRYPGRGTEGELWLRNRLFWLRTIPLDDGSAFIATHLEYPAYLQDGAKRPSDLLGLFRGKINKSITTALAVVELKASRGSISADDNLIYAVLEASRNALLNYQGLQRLRDGWNKHISEFKDGSGQAEERLFWQTVWQEDVDTTNRSPFANLNREERIVVLIVGDAAWFDGQQSFLDAARKLNENIRREIPQLHILFYRLNESQPGSSPYSLLPLRRIS